MKIIIVYMSLQLFSMSNQVLNDEDYFVELLSKIIDYTFEQKTTVCFIKQEVNVEDIIEKALFQSNMVIFVFSLIELTNKISCDSYIIALSQEKTFLKILEFKPQSSVHFKSWSKVLLLYESPVHLKEKLFHVTKKLIIDAILVQGISQRERTLIKNEKLQESKNITLTNVLLNRTIVITDKTNQSVYWDFLRSKELIPILPWNQKFRIAVFNCSPYVYLRDNNAVYKGIEAVVFRELRKLWPLEYVIVSKDDPWFQTAELVKTKQVHLGACSPWRINSYVKNVDFAGSIVEACSTFLVEKPRMLPFEYFVLYPLSKESYYYTLFVIVNVSISLSITVKLFGSFIPKLLENITYELIKTIRLLLGGGVQKLLTVNSLTASILITIFLFFCTLFSTLYSAGITSILYNPPFGPHVRSFQDMIQQKLHWFSPTHSADYLRLSGSPLHTAIANLFVPSHSRIPNETKNLPIPVVVLNQIFVCDWENIPEDRRKYYQVLRDCYMTEYTGFTLPKYSPFTRTVERVIERLLEHGIINQALMSILNHQKKYQEGFFSNYVYCNHYQTIDFNKLLGAYLLLAVGLGLSTLIFFFEVIYNCTNPK